MLINTLLPSWNIAPSPGWSKADTQLLKLCLMQHGIGQWAAILRTGLLPGKQVQQISGQTQRLMGQQSLAGEPLTFLLR